MSNASSLAKLGFTQWFRERLDPQKTQSCQVARILTVHGDRYVVGNGETTVFAESTGTLMFSAETSLDLPAVGDWVYVRYYDDDQWAVIHGILPRKSLLKRKTAGKKIDFQLIAANIDKALIIQSLDANYNIRRLERYLVMVTEAGIQPVVLLSKSDLATPQAVATQTSPIYNIMPELDVVPFSNKTGQGLPQIWAMLTSAGTFCLLGSSGVGKTTLLNRLLGQAVFKTREIKAKDGKGRHTTTLRQLILLQNGALMVDTPGMRELGTIAAADGLQDTFAELAALACTCRFNNCSHTKEKGCALLAAVAGGTISKSRYDHFIKLTRESARHAMSYYEKRKKDKQLAKLYKSIAKKRHHRNA